MITKTDKYKQKPQKNQQRMWKYFGFSHQPQRCPAYWLRCKGCIKLNHFGTVCKGVRHKDINEIEQETDEYIEEDRQIDTVNIDFINSNVKGPGNIAKLDTSSFQSSVNILYKIDMGSNRNILTF